MEQTNGSPAYRWLASNYAAAPQPEAANVAILAAQGFRSIINIRPDGEQGQFMTSAEAERQAQAHGLAYMHLPVRGGLVTAEDKVKAFEAAIERLPKPVFAYCSTGTRAAILWAFSSVRHMSAEDALTACLRAGYDLSFFGEQLRERRRANAKGGIFRLLAGLWRRAG